MIPTDSPVSLNVSGLALFIAASDCAAISARCSGVTVVPEVLFRFCSISSLRSPAKSKSRTLGRTLPSFNNRSLPPDRISSAVRPKAFPRSSLTAPVTMAKTSPVRPAASLTKRPALPAIIFITSAVSKRVSLAICAKLFPALALLKTAICLAVSSEIVSVSSKAVCVGSCATRGLLTPAISYIGGAMRREKIEEKV